MGYTKKDIYVGRTVYLKPGYNKSRYEKGIKEDKILKVGRKYFELEGGYRTRYHIDTLKEDTERCEDYHIYLDKQVIIDKREKSNLISYMKSVFGYGGYTKEKTLTIDQLRRINKIMKEDDN